MSMALGSILLFCFSFALVVQQVSAWNSDKPIYKWSPISLGYNQYLGKRYNDDKPILKWNPSWFTRHSSPIYTGKRDMNKNRCRLEEEPCAIINYDDSDETSIKLYRCCGDLKCRSTGDEFVCTNEMMENYNEE